MSTVNASKRSALSRPSKYRRRFQQYVVLQLQLPRDAPFGSESFFCQLLIHNRVWEEEDGLFEQLNRNASHITIAVFNNAQRLHPIPHAHPDLAVVEAVNWSGHLDVLDGGTNHVRVALNARLHVEHVERDPAQGGKIWLVRATLLSGGISFLRASNDLSGPDITDTIWPGGGGEQLQGIFVSGSDLQIEVRRRVSSSGFPQFLVRRFRLLGVKRDEEGVVSEAIWEHTRARKVLSYFFPRRIAEIEQPDQRVAGQLGKFRARCRRLDPPIEVALGDVLKSLPAGSLADELDRERVPQEIKDALGVSGDGEVAILERGHEWQLDIQDRQFIIQLVSKENSRGVNAAWLDIYEAPTGDSTRTIARVSINEEEALEREEFLKTDLSLRIRTDSSPEAPRVAWRPQTLFVVETSSEDYSFTLVDTDVAEQLLRSGVTTDTSARAEVSFQWSTKASERTQRLPETELAGTSVAPNAAAQDLWFQARCAPGNKSPYPQAPAALVHISAAEPNGTPTRDDAAAARLSGPLLFQTGDADTNSRWRCQVVPAGSISRAVTTSSNRPRVQLELEGRLAELTAELKFHAPDVTVDSPTVAFYDVPLNDPQSAPNERRLHSPLVNQDGSLRFNCRAGDPPRPGTVRCVYDPGQQTFEVSRRPAGLSPTAVAAPQAATVLLPATRALVDPVSVTRGNLVALQTVAFPVYRFPSPGDANRLRVRVKEIRQVSSEPPKAQLDLEFLDTDANTIFARADLPTDGALKGFFAEFVGEGEEAGPAVVLRVLFVHQGLPSDTILTIDVKHVPGLDRLRTDDFEYRLSVGPTRLALPRDVNHGLIPLGIGKFRFAPTATNGPFPELAFVEKDVQGAESQSAFALHLWSERGPDPRFKDDSDNPQAAWLETGRVRLHHRNLVQEHAEFESSFEDRFPPEGPQVDPETGNTPSPLLPLQDFLRSVRDRYTEASGNLLQKGTNEEQKNARQLRNWLPKAELEDAGGNDARPVLQYADNPATVPEVELPAGPFDEQNLKLRKSTDDDLDRHWLDVDLRPEVIDVGKRPEVRIETTDPLQTATRRALDSSTPLLFEEHEVTALATANLPGLDDRTLVVVGGAGEVGAVYRYTADGELDASADFSGVTVLPLVDAALTENGRQVLGVVVASDGKAWRFVIKADLTFESIDEINRASHTAQAVAATPPGADPAFAILWQPESGDDKPVDVYQSSDWETPIQALVSSKTTAIAMDWTTKGNALLAIGFSTGGGELRDASNWETSVRTLNPLSGKHDLRSIAVVAGTYQRVATTGVFACNIKGQACHWFLTGGNAADATEWHLPGDVLSVSTGNVRNLESRREAEGAAAADLVAAGLRSGVTRVAAIRAAKRLAHVRSFDAASAPVALNTLPRLSPLDRVPRRVFRGMHNPTSVPNATAKFDWWIASDSGNVAGVPVAKGGLIVGLDTGDLSDATKVMVAPAPFGAFRGAHDASSNTNPSGSQSAGDWWVISAGGQLYSNSLDVLAGDLLVVLTHPPTDQSHVAVARRHQASSPIATGASSGKTQLADLRIGTEWVSPPTRDSSTYADALSVIRQAGAAAVNGAPGLKVFRPIAGNDIVSGLEVSAVKAAGDGATPSVDLTLKFVDSGGTEVAAAATSDANGKWSAAGIDLSSLGNGMVTLTVTEDAIPANKAWARFALNKGFSAQPPKLEQVPGAHAPDTVPRQTFVNPAAQRPRPGDIVVIHSDTQGEVGKGKVQRDGPDEQKGSFVITTKPLDPVTHKLTYTLEDPAGNVSVASEELVITIAAASPNNLVIDLPVRVGEVDHPDNVLNAGHTSSDGRRTVTLSGSGMNGQVVEVTFTHHGNGVSVPTVQDTVVDERWEVSTDIEPLGDGRITAAVVMGAQTAEAVLIVDSQPPVAKLPVQLDPTTNYDGGAVSLLNRFGGGAATFSLPPEAGGRGDTINLYVDDQQQDPVPVQGDGSAYLTIDLDAGDHRVTYQFVDTAGNQSKLSPACHIAGLIVDELSPTRDEEAEQPRYFSISTGGLKIVSDEPVADELDKANLTDIRIWADSFKVHREFKDSEDNLIHVEGAIDDLQFADDVFDPGRMLFFSAVRADQQRQLPPHELAPLDYLPRLGGVPIYVTKVTKCQLDYDPDSKSAAIRELVFTAVPVNPDEVAAGVDPADLTTTAGLVRRAASRNSSLNVRVRPGDVAPVTVDGKVDWLFSVNRQIAAPDPQPAIGGQLARLVSSSVSYDNAKNILSFVVDLDASRALVMGRLWKLEDPGAPLVVRGHGSFVRAATSGDPSPSAADSVA
ncbi:MAG: hypothetical protein MPJ50_05945, partial [Pirellulales bacterium]|nr:hypothetical protein [Pirellulales bacterium]